MFKLPHPAQTIPSLSRMLASSLLALGLFACGQVDDLTGGSSASGASDSASLSVATNDEGGLSLEEKKVDSNGRPVQTAAVKPSNPPKAATPAPSDPVSPAAPAAPATSSIYKVQTLVDDMRLPNDNNWWLAVNGDLTANYNGPDKGYGNTWAYIQNGIRSADAQSYWPKKYLDSSFGFNGNTSLNRLGWFVIARATQASPKARNTRAQTRNFKNWILYRDGSWKLGGESSIGMPYPANWHANFSSPGNETTESIVQGSGLDNARLESSGGASVGSIGYGNREIWAVHGWPADITLPQSTWVNDVVGVVTVFEARLIVHDASQPDDRADANLMVWTGADWYQGNSYIGEHSHGRLKLIKNDWNIFSTTDIPEATLKANPPPGYTN
jgi:hypothetical protein